MKYFWKRGSIRKRVRWNRGLRNLWGFKKILCSVFLFFAKYRILKALFSFIFWLLNFSDLPSYGSNSRKRYALRLVSMFLGSISISGVKLKFDELLLSKNYIPSAKTLYTEDFSNITFNYLCENSPNSLWHFWNHQSFFMTNFVCIFLAQILHFFDKSRPAKCNLLDFPLL